MTGFHHRLAGWLLVFCLAAGVFANAPVEAAGSSDEESCACACDVMVCCAEAPAPRPVRQPVSHRLETNQERLLVAPVNVVVTLKAPEPPLRPVFLEEHGVHASILPLFRLNCRLLI